MHGPRAKAGARKGWAGVGVERDGRARGMRLSSIELWFQLWPVATPVESSGRALPGRTPPGAGAEAAEPSPPGAGSAAATLITGMSSAADAEAGGAGDRDGEALGVEGSKGTTASTTGATGAGNLACSWPTAARGGELDGEAELSKLARASPARMLTGSAWGELAATRDRSSPLGDATTGAGATDALLALLKRLRPCCCAA